MIYFDNAATTQPFKEAEEAFLRINREAYGNPSSNHYFGSRANSYLEEARSMILDCLGLNKTHRCLFTSGATEGDNLAIKGVSLAYANRGKKIITDAVEHPAVLKSFEQMKEQFGYDVVILPVRPDGTVDPEKLNQAIDDQTILVSCMSVNNETGSRNDIKALSAVVHRFPKAFFHVDATQSIGKENEDYSVADLISFSGHKFGGFKGSGGLVYRNSLRFISLNTGGEQEYGFRAGTGNVAGDYAMAVALEKVTEERETIYKNVLAIRDYLYDELEKREDVVVNSPRDASPFVFNFSLLHKKASVVMEALSRKDIYVSSVSACSSKVEIVSHVLLAMGKPHDVAANSIRVSFSAFSTFSEAKEFLQSFDEIMREVHDR